MPKSGAERTRGWRERKRTSEVTVHNVKKNGVNNKDNEPATSLAPRLSHLLLHLSVIIYNILIFL
jgi:hypothetical protein